MDQYADAIKSRFRHEVEWYDYWYVSEKCMVVICHKTVQPCKMIYLSKKKVEELIIENKWDPFLLPIYQEALSHFPKET